MDLGLYKEIPISNWDTFKKHISSFESQWIFRGQREADWGLKTSLERDSNGVGPVFFEMQVLSIRKV